MATRCNSRINKKVGRCFRPAFCYGAAGKPNLMFRHRIRSYTPEYCAQLMMPLHHNNARASGEDLNAYFRKVNQILVEKGSPARAFNPEPYKWYTVNLSLLAEND